MNENLQKKLKHNQQTFIDKEFIKEFLWYSYNNQCPIQSNRQYENSWFNKLETNIYCAIVLKQVLGLDIIKLLNSNSNIDNDIKNNRFSNVLFMVKSKMSETFFECFFNKLRNSIAHGTFNNVKKTIYFIGQERASINSQINFYLMLNNTTVKKLNNSINKGLKILEEGNLYRILTPIIGLVKYKDSYSYKNESNQRVEVIINTSNNEMIRKDIDSLLNENDKDNNQVIILCKRINKKILNANIQSEDGRIRVIDYRHIVETFDLKNIYLG